MYLHQRNILHRDIKPQNILLMGGGKDKIADFGISKAMSGGLGLNVSKIGTPIYTSPEVLRKQPFDFKIDIWALGCMIHYIASLEPPYSSRLAEKSPVRNY